MHIYGWDKDFIIHDEFEAQLKEDAAALDLYRLQKFPLQDDSLKEADYAQKRNKIRIIPSGTPGFESTSSRMWHLRRSLNSYYEADCKEGRYGSFTINAQREEQILQIYGWTKEFVMQDDFEAQLKEDAVSLELYRFQKLPSQDDTLKEAEYAQKRDKIRIIPHATTGFIEIASRMGNIRKGLKSYYKAGRKEGNYAGYRLNAQREEQILHIYDWDKDFIMQDDFEAQLKEDAAALEIYRLQKFPPQDDPLKEAEYAKERSLIRVVPAHAGFETTAGRMGSLRRGLKAYYKAGKKEGKYAGYRFNAQREELILRTYGWDREFVDASAYGKGKRKKPKECGYRPIPKHFGALRPASCMERPRGSSLIH